jgi:hypothetical protein
MGQSAEGEGRPESPSSKEEQVRVLPRGLERPDLVCAGCGSYVHRFLERCPMCGIERGRRLDDAVDAWNALRPPRDPGRSAGVGSDPAGAVTGLAYGETLDEAREDAAARLGAAEGHLQLAQLALRHEGGLPDVAGAVEVRMSLAGGQIHLTGGRGGATLIAIRPAEILAAMPSPGGTSPNDRWVGMLAPGRSPATPLVWGRAFSIAVATAGPAYQFGLANPQGMFATKARPDYFRVLAGEFAAIGDAAVDVAVLEAGPLAYARRIGLLPAEQPSLDRSADEPPTASGPTLAGLLAQLTEAFEAGLLTKAEFEAKRREVVDRF